MCVIIFQEDECEGYEETFGKLHSLTSQDGCCSSEQSYNESGYASRADSIKNGGSVSSGRHTPDYDEDDEDEEAALEALENWITNDEDYSAASDPTMHVALPASKPKTTAVFQGTTTAPTRKPEMSSRERARKASRDLKREQNDTTGGSRVSLKRSFQKHPF